MEPQPLPVLFNPQTLISDYWIPWSENYLSKKQTGSGFQDVLPSSGSVNRTRAVELYDLGLLRGRLIKPRIAGEPPIGWVLLTQGEHVHTALGYIAYAIGSARVKGLVTVSVQKAWSILCQLFILRFGFVYKEKYILTSSLYLHLQDQFKSQAPLSTESLRLLAAAMFCTLDDDSLAEPLLEAYLDKSTLPVFLITDTTSIQVDSGNIKGLTNEFKKFSYLRPPKPSLYWIAEDDEPKGFWSIASKHGGQLLNAAYDIERDAHNNNTQNPFLHFSARCSNTNPDDLLKVLVQIFEGSSKYDGLWRHEMQSLQDGILDSLKLIGGDSNNFDTTVFYGHDIKTNVTDLLNVDDLVVEVPAGEFPTSIKEGSLIVLGSLIYKVVSISNSVENPSNEKAIHITVKRK